MVKMPSSEIPDLVKKVSLQWKAEVVRMAKGFPMPDSAKQAIREAVLARHAARRKDPRDHAAWRKAISEGMRKEK